MNLFLIIALIGLLAAAINDVRKREVADWLSYSLFAVMAALTLIYSIINNDFSYVLKAALFAISIYIGGSALYYAKLIGGGDVKLLTAISPVFIFLNIWNFIALMILTSGIYGMIYSIALAAIYRKKMKGKIKFNILPVLFCIFMISGILLNSFVLVLVSILIVCPYIIFFVSTVEKVALIKQYNPEKLTEGDWLLKDIKIGKILIKAKADGLSKKDIMLIKKRKLKVWIKEGIPYIPVFLIAFILSNLINLIEIIRAFF
jgi:Flp pilus assembly protein protease CpaA